MASIIRAPRFGNLSLPGEWQDGNGDPITPAPIGIEIVDQTSGPEMSVELLDPDLSTFRITATAEAMSADFPHTSWFRLRLLLADGTSKLSTFRYELHAE